MSDHDLRNALEDLAQQWNDDSDVRRRMVHKLRTRRRRRRAVAVVSVAAMVGAVLGLSATLDGGRDDRAVFVGPDERVLDGWRMLPEAPIEGRAHPATVWTGEEMIVWGGESLDGRSQYDDGARYDPATDSWQPIAVGPGAGRYTVVVWTGTEMLLWGRVGGPWEGTVADGLAYDPGSDEWRTLPAAPHGNRPYATGVWTGSELLVWGGYQYSRDGRVGGAADGAAYDPATDGWRTLPPAPLAGRFYQGAAWTGEEMVLWGGAAGDGAAGRSFADGAAYDPSTDSWRVLPEGPLSARSDPVLVWTGGDLLVWGGLDDGVFFPDGARYDPLADAWAADPSLTISGEFGGIRPTWIGDRLVAFDPESSSTLAAFELRPGGRSLRLPDAPLGARYWPAVVWTGAELIVWGGADPARPRTDGAAWRPAVPDPTPEQARA